MKKLFFLLIILFTYSVTAQGALFDAFSDKNTKYAALSILSASTTFLCMQGINNFSYASIWKNNSVLSQKIFISSLTGLVTFMLLDKYDLFPSYKRHSKMHDCSDIKKNSFIDVKVHFQYLRDYNELIKEAYNSDDQGKLFCLQQCLSKIIDLISYDKIYYSDECQRNEIIEDNWAQCKALASRIDEFCTTNSFNSQPVYESMIYTLLSKSHFLPNNFSKQKVAELIVNKVCKNKNNIKCLVDYFFDIAHSDAPSNVYPNTCNKVDISKELNSIFITKSHLTQKHDVNYVNFINIVNSNFNPSSFFTSNFIDCCKTYEHCKKLASQNESSGWDPVLAGLKCINDRDSRNILGFCGHLLESEEEVAKKSIEILEINVKSGAITVDKLQKYFLILDYIDFNKFGIRDTIIEMINSKKAKGTALRMPSKEEESQIKVKIDTLLNKIINTKIYDLCKTQCYNDIVREAQAIDKLLSKLYCEDIIIEAINMTLNEQKPTNRTGIKIVSDEFYNYNSHHNRLETMIRFAIRKIIFDEYF